MARITYFFVICLALLLVSSPSTADETADKRPEEMEKLDRVLESFSELAKELDPKDEVLEVLVYQCKYIQATTLRRVLENFLTSEGTLSVNEETDQITLADKKKNLPLLRKIIEKNDLYVPQILTEAQIVEFAVGKDFEKNVKVSFDKLNLSSSFVQSMQAILNTPGANPNNSDGAQFSLLPWSEDNQQLGIFLRYLETRGLAKILSAPNLVIRRGGEGSILTGDDVPIVTTEIVDGNPKTTTEFRSTGIKLNVTPLMIVDNRIRLEVNPEVSDVTGEVKSGDVSNPVISIRQVRTQLDIRDGQTLAIGGLLSTESRHTRMRIPILSAIPMVGKHLFQSERKDETEIQLVVFLKVRLLRPDEALPVMHEQSSEAQAVFETLEEQHKATPATIMQDLRDLSDSD